MGESTGLETGSRGPAVASLDLFLLCRDHFLRTLLSFPRHLNCAPHCIMPGIMTPRAGGLDSHDP
jgi:hypothetical protein